MLRDSIFRVLDAIKWNSGRFPFGRTDRPADHSNHNENFTFIQNYPKLSNQILNSIHEGDGVPTKLLEKSIFHCQNDWSGYDPAGQL